MKRILLASLLVIVAATSSFAAASSDIDFANAGKSVVAGKTADSASTEALPIGKTSTGVALAFVTETAGYAIITQHKLGVKAFGTSADSTAIYSKTVEKAAETAAPDSADSAEFLTDWTSM